MFTIKSPAGYVQQAGLCQQAGELIRPLAVHLRILTSPRAWQAVNPALSESLERAGIRWQLDYLSGECTDDNIARFQQRLLEQGAEGILAIGGGRVLDTAKAVNAALGDRVLIALPTLAATCAAWSPLAIVYNAAGGHLRSQPLDAMPALILVDSAVIAQSDVRYLRAGIVDALAKWYEFEPYQRHNPHQLALDVKVSAAWQAVEVFQRWGEVAVRDNQQQQVTQALEKVIEANIVLAGLANSVRGSLDTPGFAHVIHDTLTHQPELHDWLHGEKVGYSLLIQSLVANHNDRPDGTLLALLRHFRSPLRLPALQGDRAARLAQIAAGIHFPAASLDHLPFTITASALNEALLLTEAQDFGSH
ncbi:iron-containing alcohol dehydrogenase family protein [Erwinia sp. BC051422]|uniref:iron-containing alcohol dehydrogenase family protein n=1 Tax=Erwinia TaxID=551 RepID=UPI00263AC651|nr:MULTISPECIES: iron-containing alcohol dehydrogenase family protein [unclassified Erwinia]MDN4626140.1 iron-containing alcohol dehydrogenase family protein [Erwinia sp. PsM31]MDN8542400.1 iron-containing alcohol dehydrogenase family protein [Erwinia sp. BC051422]